MTDYNVRQFKIMTQKIDLFKEGQIGIGSLIADLEALLDVLENKEEVWEGTFRGYWFDLEQIYAAILDERRTNTALSK